jgi:hypothetical protein
MRTGNTAVDSQPDYALNTTRTGLRALVFGCLFGQKRSLTSIID